MFRIDTLIRFTNSFIISVRKLSMKDPSMRKITQILSTEIFSVSIQKNESNLSTARGVDMGIKKENEMPSLGDKVIEINEQVTPKQDIVWINCPPTKKKYVTNLIDFGDED